METGLILVMVSFSSTFCPYNCRIILASSTLFVKEKKGRRVYIQQRLTTGEDHSAYLETSHSPRSREPLWVCHPHGSFDKQLLTEVSPWNCKKPIFLNSGTAKTAFLHGSLRVRSSQIGCNCICDKNFTESVSGFVTIGVLLSAFSDSCFRLFCIGIKLFYTNKQRLFPAIMWLSFRHVEA